MWLVCKTRAKNAIVWPRDIADDPASLAFEVIEMIIWKLPIAPVLQIVSKYFETTGAIGMIPTIKWKPGFKDDGIWTLKFLFGPLLKMKSKRFLFAWKICPEGQNFVGLFEEKIKTLPVQKPVYLREVGEGGGGYGGLYKKRNIPFPKAVQILFPDLKIAASKVWTEFLGEVLVCIHKS